MTKSFYQNPTAISVFAEDGKHDIVLLVTPNDPDSCNPELSEYLKQAIKNPGSREEFDEYVATIYVEPGPTPLELLEARLETFEAEVAALKEA